MQYGNLIPKIYPTGIFIQSIEQTKTSDESGGENVFTATLTNHTQQHFVVKNGKTGSGCEGINEIRASVDSNVGTPSVEVVETDAGAKKNVNFIFKNLKGETGNIALTEEVKQHISQSVASANQYTDGAIGAVEQRIDTGDTNTLQAAKTYTDQQVQAEAQARVQGDASMLADAKQYIDTRLSEIKMPLNPVCAYDMADIKKQRGGNGILIDSSGNNHHMELIGDTPVFSKDSRIINGAYFEKFSYAQCKCPVDMYNWSISMWVMPDVIPNDYHHIFSIHNLEPFFHNNTVGSYPETFFRKEVEKGKPYHIVFTVGKDFVRAYINAKEEGCVVSSGSGLTKKELFTLGSWKADYGFYRGLIGQVLLFDRTLMKSEIQWLYHNQYYPAKRYSLAEYKADENRALLEELKKRIPAS